jgi:hypothetical protein
LPADQSSFGLHYILFISTKCVTFIMHIERSRRGAKAHTGRFFRPLARSRTVLVPHLVSYNRTVTMVGSKDKALFNIVENTR